MSRADPSPNDDVSGWSRLIGGGPTISGAQRELSDADLRRVAGGPGVITVIVASTISDLADEDLSMSPADNLGAADQRHQERLHEERH